MHMEVQAYIAVTELQRLSAKAGSHGPIDDPHADQGASLVWHLVVHTLLLSPGPGHCGTSTRSKVACC
jgi:hypothetical protein